MPEAFFHDEFNNLIHMFQDVGKATRAMVRIVLSLPHGEGLASATRQYFGFQWKQTKTHGKLMQRGEDKTKLCVVGQGYRSSARRFLLLRDIVLQNV